MYLSSVENGYCLRMVEAFLEKNGESIPDDEDILNVAVHEEELR